MFRDVVSSVDACGMAACIHAWCELAYGVHRVLQHDVMAPDKGVLKSPNTLWQRSQKLLKEVLKSLSLLWQRRPKVVKDVPSR